jgi:hypothetical protein
MEMPAELPPTAVSTTAVSQPVARPGPLPLQIPASRRSSLSFEEITYVEEASFFRKSELHMKRITQRMSRRSIDSAWSPADSRPHGLNDIERYSEERVSRTAPNERTGESHEPRLPKVRSVLPKNRYSDSTDCSQSTTLSIVVDLKLDPFTELEPFPAFDSLPVIEAPETLPPLTFDAILAEQGSLLSTLQPEQTALLPGTAAALGATLQVPIDLRHSSPPPAKHYTALLEPPQPTQLAPVPTVLRPKVPRVVSTPAALPYKAFDPNVHVVDVAATMKHAQDIHYASTVGINMANELHFEHTQTERSTSFLTRVRPQRPQTELLSSGISLGPLPDFAAELNQLADQVMGKPSIKNDNTARIEGPSPPPKTGIQRKPLKNREHAPPPIRTLKAPIAPSGSTSFLLPGTPSSPEPRPFSPEKFPLLAGLEAAKTLALKQPLPLGENTLADAAKPMLDRPRPRYSGDDSGPKPMIERSRPVECRGRDGWLHRRQDPAKQWYEETKAERLARRRREVAEWVGEGEET